jgi:RimK family alpha-L-glutamate ligase
LSAGRAALLEADAVLPRIIPNGSLEQIIYRVDALHWIEDRGVLVMNAARAIERSVDKFYTTALLREAGLPVPETVVCERFNDALAACRAMLREGDAIIKPLFGSMGHGMVRVSDPDVAFRVLRSLEELRAVFYLQRAIDHGGRDIRAFVAGGRVLGAIERRAPDGEWRTNFSRGGSTMPFALPPEWTDLAERAAAAVGADYAGVDLLPSRDGAVFVLEVNGIPGWQGLQQATGIDVAGAIVTLLEQRVRAGRPSEARA